MIDTEAVVLLDDRGTPRGTARKAEVHHERTPLHLAFSCHVVRADGHVLVTRRALSKRAWPGVWTNAFCGHPAPGEDPEPAVVRRGVEELGMELHDLALALPDFRYRAVDADGVVENEVCPVWIAGVRDEPRPDPAEVVEYRWAEPGDLAAALSRAPWAFAPWFVMQAQRMSGGGSGEITSEAWSRSGVRA